LDLLTEAKLERRFRPPAGALANLYAGYYVAELLNELTDLYDPHPELFDAADATLAALRSGDQVAQLVARFELTALRVLGHLPALDACVECGKDVGDGARVSFSQRSGGVLCQSCRVGQPQVLSISAPVLAALRRLADPAGDAWRGELDPRMQGELRAVLNHYWSHHLGHEPRMHRYLAASKK
jgi:DNA repair protein RecO (recombination protein O)